jgi:type II secretory pathway component PulM
MAAFSIKEIPLFIQAQAGFDRLEPRERMFVRIGVVFLACFFLLQFVISPYLDARQRLARSLAVKKADLEKIVQLQKEYRRLRPAGGADFRPVGQTAGFSLFSFVEEQAVHAKIKQQILSMKPTTAETDDHAHVQESIVEMKLQKITLGQLVGFLRLIESPQKEVMVRHISIQESGETYLDVIMQIVTVVKKP